MTPALIQVEYQNGNNEIVIDGNMKQTVYIYKSINSKIVVNGKGNCYFYPIVGASELD